MAKKQPAKKIGGEFKNCGTVEIPIEKKEGMVLFFHQELATARSGRFTYRLLLWQPPSALVLVIEEKGKEVAEYKIRLEALSAAVANFHGRQF